MTIITRTNLRLLLADEGKHIRDINDVYEPEHIDTETGETIPEHFPYYAEMIFLGEQVKDEDVPNMYVEEEIPDEKELDAEQIEQ